MNKLRKLKTFYLFLVPLLVATFAQSKEASSVIRVTEIQPETLNKLKKFSESPRWRRLLYYNSSGKSEVDSPLFFLSKNGKSQPYEELLENYRQMFLDSKNKFAVNKQESVKKKQKAQVSLKNAKPEVLSDEHAICKFPARFLYLNKLLRKNDFYRVQFCPKLSDFLQRATGQSISLIFSSYHLNNPSSAFGHTFLKINKHNRKQLDLLNYGINYAAETNATNPVFYALKGLMGFYKGKLASIPFHYKIREYNDYESRDLWEYELNLKPETVQVLTMHFWEMGRGWTWYYFLDGNCSYWALKMIQAVDLDLNFDDSLNEALVIPTETIKSVKKYPDLIKEVYFRPSLHKQLSYAYTHLSAKDKDLSLELADQAFKKQVNKEKLSSLSVDVLDAATLFYDYKYADEYLEDEEEVLRKKRVLLVARSKKKEKSSHSIKDIPRPSRPDDVHPPRRLGLGYEASKDNYQSLKLNYKMGFHELFDPNTGILPSIAMNYGDIALQAYRLDESEDWKFDFEHFNIIRIDSLSPYTVFDSSISWRLNIGFADELLTRNPDEEVGFVEISGGSTFAMNVEGSHFLYFLILNSIETQTGFSDNLRVGMAPLLGAKFSWTENIISLVEAKHHWFYQTSDLWQKLWAFNLKTQVYFPEMHSAIYLNLESKFWHDGFVKDDRTFAETGFRYFF